MSATSQTPEAGRFWTEPAGISPAHLLGAGILAILGFMTITVGGIGFPAAMYLDSHGYITRAADHAVIAGLAIWIVPLVIAGVAQLGAAGAIVAGTRRLRRA